MPQHLIFMWLTSTRPRSTLMFDVFDVLMKTSPVNNEHAAMKAKENLVMPNEFLH